MKRREFLKTGSGAAVGAGMLGNGNSARAEATRWTRDMPQLREKHANVIVILFDSLRWDFMGVYGSQWCKTPNLDRFAEECMVFDKAYPENLPTLPARHSMWKGRFGYCHHGWKSPELDEPLLAEALWSQGVHTALITDCYHQHKPHMGFDRGFDYVEWLRGQEGDPYVVRDINVDLDRYWKPGGYISDVQQ